MFIYSYIAKPELIVKVIQNTLGYSFSFFQDWHMETQRGEGMQSELTLDSLIFSTSAGLNSKQSCGKEKCGSSKLYNFS